MVWALKAPQSQQQRMDISLGPDLNEQNINKSLYGNVPPNKGATL